MGVFMKRLTLTCCRHLHVLNHSLQCLLLLTVSGAGMAHLDAGSAMPVCTLHRRTGVQGSYWWLGLCKPTG